MSFASNTAFVLLCLGTSLRLLAQPANPPVSGPGDSEFEVQFSGAALVSLKCRADSTHLDYLGRRRRLGDVFVQFRQNRGVWQPVQTPSLVDAARIYRSRDGSTWSASYQITNHDSPVLELESKFVVGDKSIRWTVSLRNLTGRPLQIGDLALPLPIGARGGPNRGNREPVILKHSFISGNGSFIFWMRSDREGPCLTMVPLTNTSLEYWEAQRREYRVYIHSAAAGEIAKAHGTKWRQPNTSLTLAPRDKPGNACTYGFDFRWADNPDGVRRILVEEGGIDVHVVPGMTLPTGLSAGIALRTRRKIASVKAEFPNETKIESLGAKGATQLYRVEFARLGENELTIHYGDHQHMFLEFFATEPIETLIRKRAAFIAAHQVRDTNKWYNGLFCEWNMESLVQVTPDNYDRLRGFRIYAATCDDAGLGHPAFLAVANAEFPVQREVAALDYYIRHFVWGGLQRTTNETYSYAIYGIPDWKKNRDSSDPGRKGQLHLWRIYDYPHVILMYYSMYRIAQNHPEIKTVLSAREYLRRAYGTANAMYTIPHEIWNGWSPYGTGFYNELIIVDLIRALDANGMKKEASTLRGFWERKVRNFVNRRQDLFRSEYAFDSTGFESTEAMARYALAHADKPGETHSGIPLENAERFLRTQMAANLFCRGTIEPAYYLLGSDYRGSGGNAYTLTYMSQMGGWAVLDYALHFAADPWTYLRIGYESYLSAWALMNTGTPESDYGYWYPGKEDDGGAGGGFEPAPYGTTWLGQPHHRGSWYYACEIDLGFCGTLRTAATVLADDPIFGRFCYGGTWRKTDHGIEVVPEDGLRRRFHVMFNHARLHLVSDTDRFPAGQPIVLNEDLSQVRFQLESDNPERHVAEIHLSGLMGRYTVRDDQGTRIVLDFSHTAEASVELPMDAGRKAKTFTLARESEAGSER